MQCCSFVLLEHLWPFCSSLTSWGETAGPIYWQAQFWENTISWQKTSCPEQTSVSAQTYTQPHTGMAPVSPLYLRSTQESVLTFSTDLPRANAGGSHACHYPARRFYLPVLFFPHRREKTCSPLSHCVWAFSGRTCIFKAQSLTNCMPCSCPAY